MGLKVVLNGFQSGFDDWKFTAVDVLWRKKITIAIQKILKGANRLLSKGHFDSNCAIEKQDLPLEAAIGYLLHPNL